MSLSAPALVTGFKCLQCGLETPFSFPAYRCSCGGNLDVTYDRDAQRAAFSPPDFAQLQAWGHLAFAPLLPIVQPQTPTSLPIGNSPLARQPAIAARLGLASLHCKDDSRLPSASFKDRASSILVELSRMAGIDTICTASTGNAGCSLACLCAEAGLSAVVFVPETAPAAKIAQLLFYGAKVIKVRGNYDDAFDLCWEVASREGWLNRSTGWNPFTREGKKTVSYEISQQLDWHVPDVVFAPVGDGNIISGVWKGFRDLYEIGMTDRMPRLFAVQSRQSNAIALAVDRHRAGMSFSEAVQAVQATTVADSISVDLPRDGIAAFRAVVETGGAAVEVDDENIRQAVVQLAGETGIFAEPAGATAFAGLLQAVEDGNQSLAGCRVVCLVTGNGLKDVQAAADLAGTPLLVTPDADSFKLD